MRVTQIWVLLFLAVIGGGACRNGDAAREVGGSLRDFLTGPPPTSSMDPDVWADVQDSYNRREQTPAWISDGMAKARQALDVLRTAEDHGLTPSDYGDAEIARRLEMLEQSSDAPDRADQLARLDALVTSALLDLGRDVALGRSQPEKIDSRWKARRELPDLVGTLEQAAATDLTTWLDTVRPRHPEYAALQEKLAELRARAHQGAWPIVPEGIFKPGVSNPAVVTLRQRLQASGQLAGPSTTTDAAVYDADVASAVRVFQEHHGLSVTGLVDAKTRAAMNVSLDDRLRQVALNLDRWRWMPNELGPRHLLVNIPSYALLGRDERGTVLEMRVVVGTPEHETPIFSGSMATVVFSPYWNVPDSIVEGETAPAAARDPNFLRRNSIEILRVSTSGAEPVDPASVNWDDPEGLKQLAFRQRPGAGNALGHVKFLFPNPFDVYLHDTPADALFARAGRALSHGCVRVEQPEALAAWVLRGYPEWDAERMQTAMHAGVEKHVALKEKIPVHIAYMTAWVDAGGALRFGPDVYGHDAAQAAQLTVDVPVAAKLD